MFVRLGDALLKLDDIVSISKGTFGRSEGKIRIELKDGRNIITDGDIDKIEEKIKRVTSTEQFLKDMGLKKVCDTIKHDGDTTASFPDVPNMEIQPGSCKHITRINGKGEIVDEYEDRM